MSKNTQIGELINYISVNESGNVVLSNGHLVATQNYVSTAVANLVDAAPTTLDTLNELAAALGDDPNFATTVATSIGGKLSLTGGTLTGALNGTSSVFSSNINIHKNGSGTVGSGGYYTLYNAATTDGMLWQLNASNNIDFWGLTSNSFTASPVITLTRAGAATFSSSVTALNGVLSGTGSSFADGLRINRNSNSNQYTVINHVGGATNIISVDQSGNNIPEIYFGRSINGSTISNSMIINKDGNVGIGTASPSANFILDINSTKASGASGIRLTTQSTSAGPILVLNYTGSSLSNWGIGAHQAISGALEFVCSNSVGGDPSTAGTTRMLITSSGNVGIGTNTPVTTLNISNSSHGLGLSYIPESSLPAIAGIFTNTSFGQQGYGSLLVKSRTDYAGYSISFYTAGIANDIQERMRITSGGDIGFGTNSISWAAGNRRVFEINGTTQILIGLKTGDAQKGYIFHSGTNLFLENSNSGGDFLLTQVGAGNITFSTSSAERMRISSTGNILFGYDQTTGITIGRRFATNHASANRGATLFYGIDDGGNGGMFVYNVASSSGGYNSQYISFETHEGGISAGERMRITSDGKVIVRQSNFTYPVSIEAQAGGGQLALTRGGAYTEFYMGGTTSGGTVLYVRSGGSGGVYLATGSTGWVANSDERLKTDLVPIENGLEKVVSLRSVIGRYLTDSIDKKRPFLIAQDVKKVLPEAVMTNEETGDMGLSYTEVIPLLVASIKELKAENNLLKARLDNNNIN